jgi:catechol 2,3-dioxygenase-like lactoylglutathione lyase family enzyme
MTRIVRLSHIGFNIPKDVYDEECEFWENLMGLTRTHDTPGRNAFFTADPLRDHEFILYCVDGPVNVGQYQECNHVAFDVPTDADVDEFTARLRAAGYEVGEPDGRGRRQNKVTSPAGIHFEINTPPYMNPKDPGNQNARAAELTATK